MSKTLLNKIRIEKFRALKNVDIELGNNITVICGKNGTAKSSILGIAVQIFSFEKDYITDKKLLDYKTVTGNNFKSKFNEHFRISEKYDTTGTMDISLELYDAYSEKNATADLALTMRDSKPRMVVRKNSLAKEGENTDRNFTHPVIFLSLKRLYPIPDRNSYKEKQFDYLNNENKKKFTNLSNELLNPIKRSLNATGTIANGSITSAVAHGDNYDCNSVSAGEDNVGQIVLAIMSFQKLKEECKDYKGGLLLIDEADAALFPAAQLKLIKILERECINLNLQVIMTSHSPILIERIFEMSKDKPSLYRTIYLTDSHGDIEVKNDWSWPEICADITSKTILNKKSNLSKINVYFEDREAEDMFKAIMLHKSLNKNLNLCSNISLSSTNYIYLVKKDIQEFSKKSIICLDADTKKDVEKDKKKLKSIILLPGNLPPDRLIFEYLDSLDASNDIWKNEILFTKATFNNNANTIKNTLEDNQKRNQANQKAVKPTRELFKDFYKSDDFKNFLKLKNSPWKLWVKNNKDECDKFIAQFTNMVVNIMKKDIIDVVDLPFLKKGDKK